MKKTVVGTLAITMIMFASPALAQEGDLPEPGILPGSPAYFIKGFFEGVGTFLTFGNNAKAERYLYLAEKRLAEAQALVERDGEDAGAILAAAVIPLFGEQSAKAQVAALARIQSDPDFDLLQRVADATTKHLAVLDEVLKKVPEQASESIRAAKESSITGQLEALRNIAGRDPDVAIDIFARAAEGRLMAAQTRARGYIKIDGIEGESIADNDNDSDGDGFEDALEEFERYAEFGQDISAMAQGMDSGIRKDITAGETTVEKLVERVTSHHIDILREIKNQLPPQAQESIQRALDKSTPKLVERAAPTQIGRPANSEQRGRSIPENSIEATTSDNGTEEIEATESSSGSDATPEDSENEEGGPPAGTPVPTNAGARP